MPAAGPLVAVEVVDMAVLGIILRRLQPGSHACWVANTLTVLGNWRHAVKYCDYS